MSCRGKEDFVIWCRWEKRQKNQDLLQRAWHRLTCAKDLKVHMLKWLVCVPVEEQKQHSRAVSVIWPSQTAVSALNCAGHAALQHAKGLFSTGSVETTGQDGRKNTVTTGQKLLSSSFLSAMQPHHHLEDLFTNALSWKRLWVNYQQTHSQRVKTLQSSTATVFYLSHMMKRDLVQHWQ